MIHLLFFFKFLSKILLLEFLIKPLLLIKKYIAKTDESLTAIDKKIKFSNVKLLSNINKIEGTEILKLKKIKLKILIDLNF